MKKYLAMLLCVICFTVGCNAKYKIKEEKSMELYGCTAFQLDENLSENDVTELFLEESRRGKTEGYSPVILALDRRVKEMIESNISRVGTPEEFRKQILTDTEDGKEIMENRFAEMKAEYGEDDDFGAFKEDDETLDLYIKTKSSLANQRLWSVKQITDTMLDGESAYLVRVPTSEPWEIPAWLPFGGWNECPSADEMVKVCRCWYENYGATPAIIMGDMILLRLDKPISDRQTAREISHQHAAFCGEFLWTTGLDAQTADIMTSNIWVFWWD
ncbi:MAG: DUF4253 domain-containing protein [Oscillospiraceae bacterium]|nr:DUF4253 domain-containing protein [Oscillospiraceae bacterium]